jgi:orotidine-5'-phosphate decarboxylase
LRRPGPSLPDFPGNAGPGEAAEPGQPAAPGQSDQPAAPGQSDQPAASGQSDQPAASGQPSVPGQPAVPGQAAVPVQPAAPFPATMPDWDVWAARRAEMPPSAPQSSAADLRELAELGDLLGELAGLVHDLGAMILGLFSGLAGAREREPRAFAVPPELTELAGAHRELKAEQEELSTRFMSGAAHSGAPGSADKAALRASLAALTERATRAVAAATAVSFPDPTHGQAAEATLIPPPLGTAPRGATRPLLRDHPREESRVQMQAPVAVALDAPDIDVAAHWATLVTPYASTVKIGLELYLRYGPNVVATVRGGSGVQVFLDLKLHDIPNTVAGAARAVAKLRPEILTVHAAGGADMIKAAVQAAPETLVAGVTLLTSIDDKDLAEVGVGGSVSDAVRRLAALAVSAGARGLVCSPQEVAAVRAEVGPDVLLITPGIRPAGVTSDDQARIATPVEALKAGADLLVIGRPITRAPDPGAAAAAIAMSLRHAVASR